MEAFHMLKFILQEDGKVLVDVCELKGSILCGVFNEEGQFRVFQRYFEGTRARTFSSRELYLLAQKSEELERAYEEKCTAAAEAAEIEPDPWKTFFLEDE